MEENSEFEEHIIDWWQKELETFSNKIMFRKWTAETFFMQTDLKSSDFGGKKWSFEYQEPQDSFLVMALGTLQEL